MDIDKCTTFNKILWSCKELHAYRPTTDDIEVHIVVMQELAPDEDSPVVLIELYINTQKNLFLATVCVVGLFWMFWNGWQLCILNFLYIIVMDVEHSSSVPNRAHKKTFSLRM